MFLLVACTNNYDDAIKTDDIVTNKTDIKGDNTINSKTNTEDGSLSKNKSTPIIFDKINATINYDDDQSKVVIKHDTTSIHINLFGDDESDLTLIMNGKAVNEKYDSNFDYTYSENLEGAINRIKLFATDNVNKHILILPATTEEYPTYNALLFDNSGFLHTYRFEITEWDCEDIESIMLNTQTNANPIEITDNTGKSCSTRTYIIDGKYIEKEPKVLSFKDIAERYEEDKYKIYSFDVNADSIKDKVITHINRVSSSGSGYQGDDLIVYLGLPTDEYVLSLNSINYTEDGLYYFSGLSPRTDNTGFILSTYFGSRGYPYKDYYFALNNDEWKIVEVIVKGRLGKNEFYCQHPVNYNVSSPTAPMEALEVKHSEKDIISLCPMPPTNYIVTSDKAEILTEDFKHRNPPNYYIKNDSVKAIDQNEDWVRVSYKNSTKSGWISKEDVAANE